MRTSRKAQFTARKNCLTQKSGAKSRHNRRRLLARRERSFHVTSQPEVGQCHSICSILQNTAFRSEQHTKRFFFFIFRNKNAKQKSFFDVGGIGIFDVKMKIAESRPRHPSQRRHHASVAIPTTKVNRPQTEMSGKVAKKASDGRKRKSVWKIKLLGNFLPRKIYV